MPRNADDEARSAMETLVLATMRGAEASVRAVLGGGGLVLAALVGNELLGWRQRPAGA